MAQGLIFDSEELSLKEALDRSKLIVDEKVGLIKSLTKNAFYTDEPKFYQYTAQLCDVGLFSDVHTHDKFVGGASLIEEYAMMKTIGEAVERYCLSIYKKYNLFYESYENIKNIALNPCEVVSFSKQQFGLPEFKNFKLDNNSKLYWTIGYSIFRKKYIFVPAQLVYVPYKFENEKIIRFPITTGAASGSSLAGALFRGICEVVERDAFMINYLNQLSGKLVDTAAFNNDAINKMMEEYKNYNIETCVFDITTDTNIPTMMCILIDRSGEGPAVSVGLKCHLNPREAIIGCLEEAQPARPWIRSMMLKGEHNLKNVKKQMKTISTVEERGILWSDRDMVKHLNFLFKKRKFVRIKNHTTYLGKSIIENLKILLNTLQNKVSDIIFVDVTTADIRKLGFKVVKLIIPNLQPLYLDERYRYLGGGRLYKVPQIMGYGKGSKNMLNDIPHPFL